MTVYQILSRLREYTCRLYLLPPFLGRWLTPHLQYCSSTTKFTSYVKHLRRWLVMFDVSIFAHPDWTDRIEEINKGKQRQDLYSWTISIGNWLLLCSCKSNKFEVIEVSIFWYSLRPEESHKEGIFRSVVLEGQLVRRSNELFPWKWMTMKIIPSPVPHWRIEEEPGLEKKGEWWERV